LPLPEAGAATISPLPRRRDHSFILAISPFRPTGRTRVSRAYSQSARLCHARNRIGAYHSTPVIPDADGAVCSGLSASNSPAIPLPARFGLFEFVIGKYLI
jgi:hypothetical protein